MTEVSRADEASDRPDPDSGTPPLEIWEGCTAAELASEWALPRVHIFARVGSTNDVARDAAAAGAPTGTLVIAEEQGAGRGRVGRAWSSPPGLGLYLSIVARPPRDEIESYPLRVGVAVARALDPWTAPDPVRVKWPNDIVLRDRKLGGILCEAVWDGSGASYAIVGIGLNLLQGEDDFPPDVRPLACSLREAGKVVSRFEVATNVLREVRTLILGPEPSPADGWLGDLRDRDALHGRFIDVVEPESGRSIVSGHAAGFAADGALLVDSGHGPVSVRSGTVRYR